VKLIDGTHVPSFFLGLYDYAWFAGFGIAFVVYLALRNSLEQMKCGQREIRKTHRGSNPDFPLSTLKTIPFPSS